MKTKTAYVKDDGVYMRNYSAWGRVDETLLHLINSCRYIHKDEHGEYTKVAYKADHVGNVYFKKKRV